MMKSTIKKRRYLVSFIELKKLFCAGYNSGMKIERRRFSEPDQCTPERIVDDLNLKFSWAFEFLPSTRKKAKRADPVFIVDSFGKKYAITDTVKGTPDDHTPA